jgi:hypothetical protein
MAKKPAARRKAGELAGTNLTIRCSAAWKGWVEEAAKWCRTDASKLIDGALSDYLKAKGFPKKAPER